MTQGKIKVLFVCTINRMRSATAHAMYSDDSRFEVRSAGTHPTAHLVINRELVIWADWIVVMQPSHEQHILNNFPRVKGKKLFCLNIPDVYYFDQPELREILREKFEKFAGSEIP